MDVINEQIDTFWHSLIKRLSGCDFLSSENMMLQSYNWEERVDGWGQIEFEYHVSSTESQSRQFISELRSLINTYDYRYQVAVKGVNMCAYPTWGPLRIVTMVKIWCSRTFLI